MLVEDLPEELNLARDALPDFPTYRPPLPLQNEPWRSLIAHKNPLETFQTLLTPKIVDEIVKNTNSYADRIRTSKESLDIPHPSEREWKPVCATEIWRYLGTQLLMGGSEEGRREDYWEEDGKLRGVFGLRRWEQIHRYFTLRDDAINPRKEGECFAYRVEPIATQIKRNIQASMVPASHLSIDESMISFRGRSIHKVKLPNKPIQEGFKVWAQAADGIIDDWIWHSREDGPESVLPRGEQFDRAGKAGKPSTKVMLICVR